MMMQSVRAVGVIAKAPVVGKVKTRLVPPLDPEQAAQLYGAFLRDTLLKALTVPETSVTLFHPPVDDPSTLDELLPAGVTCVEDTGSGLSDGMQQAFDYCFNHNATVAVLIGADLPTLPASFINEAFTVLECSGDDVVLGPSADGGYYLIGLRAVQPVLFDRMVWSTSDVLKQALDRARRAGLQVALLGTWHDIDDPSDLLQLMREFAHESAPTAPTTRRVLSEIWPAIAREEGYG